MRMMLTMLLFMFAIHGCGGHGDGSAGMTHNELAANFVQQLNSNASFSVTLVKNSTLKSNFIVIYDHKYGTYDAIDLSSYDPNKISATDYYNQHAGQFFYDLQVLPGYYETAWNLVTHYDSYGKPYEEWEPTETWVPTQYRDYYSGFVFEKIDTSAKDLEKISALSEVIRVENTAEYLNKEMGLTLERGQEISRLAIQWEKAGKASMTTEEHDAFASELLGVTITDAMSAYKKSIEGDNKSLEAVIKKAANTNGITPEHMNELITKFLE